MNNILTIKERSTLAQNFGNEISSGENGFNYYVTVGRNVPWSANDTLVPSCNAETTDSINTIFNDMVAMKLINASDVINVIRRSDWTADTKYTAYSNSLSMYTTVITTNGNGTVSLSNTNPVTSTIIVDDVFTVNVANQNTFVLTANTSNLDYVLISVNGLVQTPNLDFNIVSNNILKFSSNVNYGDIVEAKIFSASFSSIIVYNSFTVNTATQNAFSLSSNTSVGSVILTINGLVQTPNLSYTIVGNNVLQLVGNAVRGDIVEAKIFAAVASGPAAASLQTTIIGNNTTFLLDYSVNDIMQLPGDGISVFPQQREVISITSNTILSVNLAFTGNIVSNTPQLISNTYPNHAYNFYVRNSYDQVFVCLGNNNGSISTVMPQISVGGDLPTNSYIVTTDGYFWKYMYTMSAGQKQLFMTQEWMPVSTDYNVLGAAVDGRLDVINIINPGTGYNNSSATFNAPILSVIGNGTGANLTAQVNSTGSIVGVNVLNGGSGYTYATILVNGGTTGANANLQAVIGPAGGWGSNNLIQLGSTATMISMTLNDTESGTIPTVDVLGDYFSYRQICILKNPEFIHNEATANGLNYDLTTSLPLPSNTALAMNDVIYQSSNGNFAAATFTATVVYFDVSTYNLHINNINGNFTPGQPIYSTNTSLVTVTNTINPSTIEFGSGDIEYVENRLPVERSPGQTENLKIIVSF